MWMFFFLRQCFSFTVLRLIFSWDSVWVLCATVLLQFQLKLILSWGSALSLGITGAQCFSSLCFEFYYDSNWGSILSWDSALTFAYHWSPMLLESVFWVSLLLQLRLILSWGSALSFMYFMYLWAQCFSSLCFEFLPQLQQAKTFFRLMENGRQGTSTKQCCDWKGPFSCTWAHCQDRGGSQCFPQESHFLTKGFVQANKRVLGSEPQTQNSISSNRFCAEREMRCSLLLCLVALCCALLHPQLGCVRFLGGEKRF